MGCSMQKGEEKNALPPNTSLTRNTTVIFFSTPLRSLFSKHGDCSNNDDDTKRHHVMRLPNVKR